MTLRAVFSYVNPDTDGVACMLAYKELLELTGSLSSTSGLEVRPGIFGVVNAETQAIMKFLNTNAPENGMEFLAAVDEICLVDTHHRSQLPPDLDFQKVMEVIDHHGGGDQPPEGTFFQNERVGAAATLIIERFKLSALRPNDSTALLLACAVLSNTLDFSAPSATDRDWAAMEWLNVRTALPPDLLAVMRQGRAALLEGSTLSVLSSDVKVFVRRDGSQLAMCQIEAPNAASLGTRPGVSEILDEVARNTGSIAALANLVDTALGRSLLICSNEQIKSELRAIFNVSFDSNDLAWTEEIYLRKTHLVPGLIGD